MIMYIWFGVGSVPWIGQGKYVLAQLLFLFAGVITTHQLDVMYVLILTAIIVADPHLSHLSHTYSVWSLCTKGVPYLSLCTILCKYYCTTGLTFDKGPVGKQALIPPVEGHVGIGKKPHMSLTASKRAQDLRDPASRNWYALVKWANPFGWINKSLIDFSFGDPLNDPLNSDGSSRTPIVVHVKRSMPGELDRQKFDDRMTRSAMVRTTIMGVSKGAPEENWFITSRIL